ncbi:MAG: RRXRR domain-containing protein, partial [Algiphilus sp.]
MTIETWVKRLCQFAPIAEIRQELVRFDMQQMENPETKYNRTRLGLDKAHWLDAACVGVTEML